MIFQSGKYCDIMIHQKVVLGYVEETEYHTVRIRDTGDTHLDIAALDLPHALELWTAIEKSPEVKIAVHINDFVVKEVQECPQCNFKHMTQKKSLRQPFDLIKEPRFYGEADAYPPLDYLATQSNHDPGSEVKRCTDCNRELIHAEDKKDLCRYCYRGTEKESVQNEYL